MSEIFVPAPPTARPTFIPGLPRSVPAGWSIPPAISQLTPAIVLGLLAAASIWLCQPPAAVPATAPESVFSSGRAMRHVHAIARTPHPTGSAAQRDAEQYLLLELSRLGVRADVQSALVIDQPAAQQVRAARVRNVVGRLPGTHGPASVLLAAHYDSTPTTPGAGDNAAAVAALLETARLLAAAGPMRNDVIVLFTDAEEVGLLGAKAFTEQHPLARDVAMVINLDGRGNAGPALMLETRLADERLVAGLARALPRVLASSLFGDAYRLLPSATDFSQLLPDRPGFNIAGLAGAVTYHTALDRAADVDARLVQQHGSYALALARQFGNADLTPPAAPAAVTYFNLPGGLFVHHSAIWSRLVSALGIVLVFAVLVRGRRRRQLTWPGIGLAAMAVLIAVGLTAILTVATIAALLRTRQTLMFDSALYMLAFTALTIAIVTACDAFFRRVNSADIAMGGLLWWPLPIALAAVFVPGTALMLTMVLIPGLLAVVIRPARRSVDPSRRDIGVWMLGAAVTIATLTPVVWVLFTGFTLPASPLVMALVVLALAPMVPVLRSSSSRPWMLPAVAAVCATGFIGVALARPAEDGERRRANHLFYVLDADEQKSYWASADGDVDAWTSRFVSRGTPDWAFGTYLMGPRRLMRGDAPPLAIEPAAISVIADERDGANRTLRLRIQPNHQLSTLTLGLEAELQGITMDGQPIDPIRISTASAPSKLWEIDYRAVPPGGVELVLQLRAPAVTIKVIEGTYGLPALPPDQFAPRPPHMMARPMPFSDTTLIFRSIRL